jgi:hypothetical protein
LDRDAVGELIGYLEAAGTPTLAAPLAVTLPDPWDRMFIEFTVAAEAVEAFDAMMNRWV